MSTTPESKTEFGTPWAMLGDPGWGAYYALPSGFIEEREVLDWDRTGVEPVPLVKVNEQDEQLVSAYELDGSERQFIELRAFVGEPIPADLTKLEMWAPWAGVEDGLARAAVEYAKDRALFAGTEQTLRDLAPYWSAVEVEQILKAADVLD